jgi:5-methyltetrahydrofolate--homocysteine methyltransferase
MSVLLERIAEDLYHGRAEKVAEATREALDGGVGPGEILNGALVAGMDNVGRDFKANVLYVPEVLVAARAMHAAMDILRPLLVESDVPSAGKFMIGTVRGDLHDIGKNLVAMMMEGGGYEIIDLGVDVSPEQFVEAVKEQKPDLVGMSALLTTTMPAMKETIEALKAAAVLESVKVMVGGAPLTQDYADEIGADGYAADAASAVSVARELVGAR